MNLMNDTETDPGRELARRLRALADWVETRPVIAEQLQWAFYTHRAAAFCTADAWPEVLREAGTFTKDSDDGHLTAVVAVAPDVNVRLNVAKTETCERVQVGEAPVEREVYPDDVKPTVETVMEPVYEWVCPDSWLEPVEAT